MNIRVRTGSRLHFGLLSLPVDPVPERDAEAGRHAPARIWGGAGLMVAKPGVDLEAGPAPHWAADGPLADRICDMIRRFRQSLMVDLPEQLRTPEPQLPHFRLQSPPPQHQGLGTGTQLALAVARILAEFYHLRDMEAPKLAQRVGRGLRSALGIHGFDHGGFVVDGGKVRDDRIAPLVARTRFPEAWRVVLILFPAATGIHGKRETDSFQQLGQRHAALDTDALCRLLLLGMLPALAERDLPAFGEALYEFNRRVGEAFAPVQGGVYAHPGAADIVTFLRHEGIAGVGQSSWGPGLFAIVEDAERAGHLAERLRERFNFRQENVIVTQGLDRGAEVIRLPD